LNVSDCLLLVDAANSHQQFPFLRKLYYLYFEVNMNLIP